MLSIGGTRVAVSFMLGVLSASSSAISFVYLLSNSQTALCLDLRGSGTKFSRDSAP